MSAAELPPAFRLMLGLDKPERPTLAPIVQLHAAGTEAATRYGSAALTGECDRVATAPTGTRNHILNKAAFNLAQLVEQNILPHDTTRDQLRTAALMSGLTAHETDATLDSAFKGASVKPRATVQLIDTPDLPPAFVLDDDPAPEAEGEPDVEPKSDEQELAEGLERRHAHLLNTEIEQQRARREAKALLDAEEALRSFRVPPYRPTLTEELAIPDEPVAYTVADVLPRGGNVLLAAQFKTGKTTLVNSLAKAVADQEKFLGRFDVANIDGRVALFNYEVDDRQYRRWLREVGITNTDQVVVLNLRGYRLPITVPHIEDWTAAWLAERDVKMWLVDPFARAFTGCGTSENDNTEVGKFLDTLDVIKNRAGVSDLILPTHTGRAEFEMGEERARGATRLDDWADVRWFLTKDEDDVRYFRATGRDVEVPEEKLTFDETTRALVFGGGDRAWEKKKRLEDIVVAVIQASPGITGAALRADVRAAGGKGRNEVIDAATSGAERGHRIRVDRGGTGASTRHYLAGIHVLEDS